ncbi:MAG: hypothetical protein K8F25_16325 [Fimbriimonadaceae bacterium]|nr:hypothetical protein [Alphaproteobacteria bacterium]
MSAEIIPLHARPPLLAGYLRVGHKGHRRLDEMLAAGKLQYKRFVFDASHLADQTDLLRSLKKAGCEIVLDPNFSEMFFEGKFKSSVTQLPWANRDRPWAVEDFRTARNFDVARAIAEFSIKHGINTILAPSHLIDLASVESISVDYSLCESLRKELDRMGGSDIHIDFQLNLTAKTLADISARQRLLSGFGNLPIDNVWLRIENFGATSTGVAARSFIENVRAFHVHEKPVAVDYAGGLVGLSTLSFGAAGGMCHGIGMKEKFNISSWKKSGGGGGGTFIYVADLDRYLKPDQLNCFFEAKGSKSKFGCNDRDCCKQLQDMFDHHDEHYIVQRSKRLSELAKIPVERRADYFLLNLVGNTLRTARAASALKINDTALRKSLLENKKRLQRFEEALVNLNGNASGSSNSRVPVFRGGSSSISAVLAGR